MNFKIALSTIVVGILTGFNPSTALADNIVIFGASGNIGQAIVKEALSRGHQVTGVSRSPDKFSYKEDNFTGLKGDPTDLESVKEIVKDADAIISAVGGRDAKIPEETAMNKTAIALTTVLKDLGANGPQVVIIGGGMTMRGSPEAMIEAMPATAGEGTPMRALFLGHWVAYQTFKASNINWTFLAPPLDIMGFRGGEDVRTGYYRSAISTMVVNADGKNQITKSDLAVAALDFAEQPYFNQLKVTVGE